MTLFVGGTQSHMTSPGSRSYIWDEAMELLRPLPPSTFSPKHNRHGGWGKETDVEHVFSLQLKWVLSLHQGQPVSAVTRVKERLPIPLFHTQHTIHTHTYTTSRTFTHVHIPLYSLIYIPLTNGTVFQSVFPNFRYKTDTILQKTDSQRRIVATMPQTLTTSVATALEGVCRSSWFVENIAVSFYDFPTWKEVSNWLYLLIWELLTHRINCPQPTQRPYFWGRYSPITPPALSLPFNPLIHQIDPSVQEGR